MSPQRTSLRPVTVSRDIRVLRLEESQRFSAGSPYHPPGAIAPRYPCTVFRAVPWPLQKIVRFVHPSLELSKSTAAVFRSGRPRYVRGISRARYPVRFHESAVTEKPMIASNTPCGGFNLHWRYGDLNPRPMACKATALATELYPQARFPAREQSLLARIIRKHPFDGYIVYRKGRRV